MAAPLIGLILIIFGIIMLGSELLSINLWHYIFQYWPVILIIYGLIKMVSSKKNRSISFIILLLGLLLMAVKLDLFHGNIWTILLAVIIILSGYKLLSSNSKKYDKEQEKEREEDPETIDADILNDRFIFSGETRKYSSTTFSGGDIDLYFSKINLDLSQVIPLSTSIEINSRLVFSELKIKIPQSWLVYVNDKRYIPEGQDEDAIGLYQLRINLKIQTSDLEIIT